MHDPPELNLTQALRVIWDGHGYLNNLYETGTPSDYDNSGVVNGDDFLAWQRHLGERHHTLPNDPHAVDDQTISQLQLGSWESSFGPGVLQATRSTAFSPDTSAIPEPEPIALLLLSVALLFALRRSLTTQNRPFQ
ncbi:MAG: hypothetical protein AAF961_03985 [Planctomycetota bacterium]